MRLLIPLLFLLPLILPAQERPNIIFLLTDDQRWDAVGFMGNDIVQTPHLDSLAAGGTVFENAYVTTSICAISRASILSGQYALHHGIRDFQTNFSDSAWQYTYPAQLREAGYYTGFIGKYGVGWIDQEVAEARFDRWYAFNGRGKYELTDSSGNYLHLTHRMADESLDFIDSAPDDQPFCLSVSFKAPHVQDVDPRQFIYDSIYHELYGELIIPEPETATPAYFERLYPFLQTSEARRRWGLRFATPEMYQEKVKGYYRLITGIDDAVDRITTKLRQAGKAENTIIVLIGDNGFYLGEHGLAGKWFGHEESIRVPLMVYDPRRPGGQRLSQIALNVDIAPTLLTAAGVAVPEGMQGRSLFPLIEQRPGSEWRQDFYYEHPFDVRSLDVDPDKLWPIPRSEGIVSLNDKYLYYYDEPAPNEEMYDLREDPHEIRNLIELQQYRGRRDSLRARMEVLKEAVR